MSARHVLHGLQDTGLRIENFDAHLESGEVPPEIGGLPVPWTRPRSVDYRCHAPKSAAHASCHQMMPSFDQKKEGLVVSDTGIVNPPIPKPSFIRACAKARLESSDRDESNILVIVTYSSLLTTMSPSESPERRVLESLPMAPWEGAERAAEIRWMIGAVNATKLGFCDAAAYTADGAPPGRRARHVAVRRTQ